ncbi:hypothetical protein [Paenisporosarcina quisquiliarum]|uniref:hypothetical protein n=1 Tax=Paenisporosarcina quisquiliarum TaxID=365346 RepID=UPI003736EC0D
MRDDQFHNKINSSYTLHDLLKGKDLEIITASLLLLGKLKVDYVSLFRNTPDVSVTLIGKYKKTKEDKANSLTEFLNENGDITMDEVFEALSKRMNNKGT